MKIDDEVASVHPGEAAIEPVRGPGQEEGDRYRDRGRKLGAGTALGEPLEQDVAAERVSHRGDGCRRMPFAQAAQEVSDVAGLAGVVGPRQPVRLPAAPPEVHDRTPPAAADKRAEQTLHVR